MTVTLMGNFTPFDNVIPGKIYVVEDLVIDKTVIPAKIEQKNMWTLEDLQYKNLETRVPVKSPVFPFVDRWVPARPLNYSNKIMTLLQRFKRAWAVWTGKADAFIWPGGQ